MRTLDDYENFLEEDIAHDKFNMEIKISLLQTLRERKMLAPNIPILHNNAETITEYTGYPIGGDDLLAKFRCIEEKMQKIWSKTEIVKIITSIEGAKKVKGLDKSIYHWLNQYTDEKNLIVMQFNGSQRYTFYTTNKTWIEKADTPNGTKMRIKEKYIDYKKLGKLSYEARNQDNIKWQGIDITSL